MKKIVSMLLLLALMLTLAPFPTLAQGDIACENEVVVQTSDFLSTIADKYYGNILAFPAIVEATNAQGGDFAKIDNPDAIEPGWKLCIPSVEDAQAILGQQLPTTAAAASTADGEKIELRIAWWGSQNRHDRTIKVIEMYEAENPNVDIVYEFAGWEDYWTKTAPQAAGGNLPDIMQQDYARIEEWVARDLLMPLDSYVESGAIDLSDVPAGSINGGRVGGTLYAINLGNNSQTLILDADAFAKAGLEIPPQDWTWADFEKITMELHNKLGIWGMGPGLLNEQIWKSLYLGHGEWSYSNDGSQLGYTDDQIYAGYLHLVLRLQEAGAMTSREEELARFTGTGPELDPIVTGESAIASYWSNQIVAIQSAAGEERNFVLTHLPRPEGGAPSNYLKPSQFFSITKQAKHPEEAAKFISYFTNNIEANKVLLAERGVPISPAVQEALLPLLGKPQIAMFDYLKRVEADSSPIRPADPPGHADLVNNVFLPEVIDPVMFGLITPEEGVATLREMGSEILAQQE
ncbi:MAG: extracellular solute-binding protein [Chloroflexi bacterium]|nr:extracellular solute-binding protein [Chloroflexota bacterium]